MLYNMDIPPRLYKGYYNIYRKVCGISGIYLVYY